MQNKYTLDYIKDNQLIIFEGIGGSHAYGTNTENSDVDIRGIFIAEFDDVLCGNFPEQINDDNNDIVYYEISRFLTLLKTNNPNILELLNLPEDCIKIKHDVFDLILEHGESFITKQCRNSFGKYASSQIIKAKGLNKKQNWENDKVTRKDVLDFVYVIENEKSILWKSWNQYKRYDEKFCGVVNIPNAKDVYSVYFDEDAYSCFSDNLSDGHKELNKKRVIESTKPMGLGYKGLIKTDEGANAAESNQLRLSSIPKGEKPICTIVYNKDAYTQHCKDYQSYREWLLNRNETRYVENKKHGQKLDGKNLMHCIRLTRMAKEISNGEGIKVRRDDKDYLLSIRRGEVTLDQLIDEANAEIQEMEINFNNSNLPDKVNPELIYNLLIKIRKTFYNIV
jgi:predicted nucleotidyltransferase